MPNASNTIPSSPIAFSHPVSWTAARMPPLHRMPSPALFFFVENIVAVYANVQFHKHQKQELKYSREINVARKPPQVPSAKYTT